MKIRVKIHEVINNIKMDLRRVGLGGGVWINARQDGDQWKALMSTVMDLWVP
jgi:hypothetical protein